MSGQPTPIQPPPPAPVKPSLLDATHPFAATLNAALIYVSYLLLLGAGFLTDFAPPLAEAWAYGVLLFGGLLITLLLQMKAARRFWNVKTQNVYISVAAVSLVVAFVAYIVLINWFVVDYGGRDLVIGWQMQADWIEKCKAQDLTDESGCIEFFGDRLKGSARADVFYGRLQLATVVTALQLAYCLMAFTLIFALTGVLEILRPKI